MIFFFSYILIFLSRRDYGKFCVGLNQEIKLRDSSFSSLLGRKTTETVSCLSSGLLSLAVFCNGETVIFVRILGLTTLLHFYWNFSRDALFRRELTLLSCPGHLWLSDKLTALKVVIMFLDILNRKQWQHLNVSVSYIYCIALTILTEVIMRSQLYLSLSISENHIRVKYLYK